MSIFKKFKSLFKKCEKKVESVPTKHLVGDVNGDGIVDTSDITLLTDIILGKYTPKNEEEWKRADVNGDGKVDVADVTALTDIVLKGKSVQDPYCVMPPVDVKDGAVDSKVPVDFHDSFAVVDASVKSADIKKDKRKKKK